MKNLISLTTICLLLCLTACSPFAPIKSPTVNEYSLERASTLRLSKQPSNKTLLVSVPEADAAYASTQMVYLLKPYQLQAFAENEWAVPPTQMLQPLLVQSLRNTGYFHAVVAAPSVVDADLLLDSKLLRLQQNFIKRPSRIEMAVQVNLFNKDSQVIASKHFSQVVLCQAENPQAGVVAANQATQKILQQVARFVIAHSRNPKT